jgi:hypothetical protein
MPQPYVHGPGHLFPFIGAGKQPVYLGTAENTPRLEIRPAHTPYFNSIFSTRVPMDWNDQGAEAFLIADVNRWSEPIYQALSSRPNPGGTPGLQAPGELGSVVIFEGLSFPLAIQFPYFFKQAMSAGGMVPGYRLLNVRLVGPDTLEPINMEPSKRRLIFHALPTISIGPNNSTITQLWDYNMSGLPTVS